MTTGGDRSAGKPRPASAAPPGYGAAPFPSISASPPSQSRLRLRRRRDQRETAPADSMRIPGAEHPRGGRAQAAGDRGRAAEVRGGRSWLGEWTALGSMSWSIGAGGGESHRRPQGGAGGAPPTWTGGSSTANRL